jgi:hypothetical protein
MMSSKQSQVRLGWPTSPDAAYLAAPSPRGTASWEKNIRIGLPQIRHSDTFTTLADMEEPRRKFRDRVAVQEELEAIVTDQENPAQVRRAALADIAKLLGLMGKTLGDVSSMSDEDLVKTLREISSEQPDLLTIESS